MAYRTFAIEMDLQKPELLAPSEVFVRFKTSDSVFGAFMSPDNAKQLATSLTEAIAWLDNPPKTRRRNKRHF